MQGKQWLQTPTKVQMNSEKATYIPWFFYFFFHSNAENSYMLFCGFKFYRGKKEMQNTSQTIK